MKQASNLADFNSKVLPKAFIVLQFIIIVGTYLNARTKFIWFWAIFSFIPASVICLISDEKRHVLPSLLLLFVSQHAIFIFAQPTWGYSFRHDSINDFHVASIISENTHFELGRVGYGSQSYSYYPLLHLFSVSLSKISGLPLIYAALYIVPVLNASFVSILMYYLNFEFFGLRGRIRNIATLLFAMGWYYTLFQSQFTREVFAFPFALLSILIAAKITKKSRREHGVMLPILFAAVILSHHMSSYMLFVILAIIALTLSIFHKNNRLNKHLLLIAIMLASYVSFVTLSLFIQQATSIYDSVLVMFQAEKHVSVMKSYALPNFYLMTIYYVIIGIFTLLGGVTLLYERRKKKEIITPETVVTAFFLFVFLLCALMRASTQAGLLSWVYDMSLRGTIWAFIGLSFIMAIGFERVMKLRSSTNLRNVFIMTLIFCILAAGKFAQYPIIISNSTIVPDVTYSRYTAALWLREEALHGSELLVAPYASDPKAFEASRNMAPYAYLRQYFGDEGRYNRFNGYIPLIGGFFDQFNNLSSVNVVYNNGETSIGYKGK